MGEGSFNGVAKAKSNFKYFRYLLVEIFTFFWLRSQAFVACCLFFLLLLCNCAHQKKGGKVGELPKRRRWNGLRGQASCGAGEPETAGWLAALKVRLQGSILDIWNAKKHCILFHIQRNSMEAKKKKTLHIIAKCRCTGISMQPRMAANVPFEDRICQPANRTKRFAY